MNAREERILKALMIIASVLSFAVFAAFGYFFISGKSGILDRAIAIASNGTADQQPCETLPEPAAESQNESIQPADSADTNTDATSQEETESAESVISHEEEDIDTLTLLGSYTPIDPEYVPDGLVSPSVEQYEQQSLLPAASEALEQMFAAAEADGIHLYFISGYRSYQEQQSLWYTYESEYGTETANQMDSVPGKSEHQLGLAADLGDADYLGTALRTEFDMTPGYQWLHENSWKYGWIERYPADKEDVTEIMYSPWAYRYFGKTLASDIHNSGLCAEEYFNSGQG